MLAMFDRTVSWCVPGRGAGLVYDLGELPAHGGGRHVVALALADMGNNIASARGTLLLAHFPAIEAIVMVGIAGGVPNHNKADEHVRLGDVVISDHRGVIQYDFVKKTRTVTEVRASPRPPHARLLEAVRLLDSDALAGARPWEAYADRAGHLQGAARPDATRDALLASRKPFTRVEHPADPKRTERRPRLFRGPIASGNALLKDPVWRDRLRDQHGVKAVEMEASGIADATWMHGVGYLAVRGICDYCDSNKNDDWHMYAAIVAAAYVRALLGRTASADKEEIAQPKSVPAACQGGKNEGTQSEAFYDARALITAELPSLLHECGPRPRPLLKKLDAHFTIQKGDKLDQWVSVCEWLSKSEFYGFELAIRLINEVRPGVQQATLASALSNWVSRFTMALLCPQMSSLVPHLRRFAAGELHRSMSLASQFDRSAATRWVARRTRLLAQSYFQEHAEYWRNFESAVASGDWQQLQRLGNSPAMPVEVGDFLEDETVAALDPELSRWMRQVENVKIAITLCERRLLELRERLFWPTADFEGLRAAIVELRKSLVTGVKVGYFEDDEVDEYVVLLDAMFSRFDDHAEKQNARSASMALKAAVKDLKWIDAFLGGKAQ